MASSNADLWQALYAVRGAVTRIKRRCDVRHRIWTRASLTCEWEVDHDWRTRKEALSRSESPEDEVSEHIVGDGLLWIGEPGGGICGGTGTQLRSEAVRDACAGTDQLRASGGVVAEPGTDEGAGNRLAV